MQRPMERKRRPRRNLCIYIQMSFWVGTISIDCGKNNIFKATGVEENSYSHAGYWNHFSPSPKNSQLKNDLIHLRHKM